MDDDPHPPACSDVLANQGTRSARDWCRADFVLHAERERIRGLTFAFDRWNGR